MLGTMKTTLYAALLAMALAGLFETCHAARGPAPAAADDACQDLGSIARSRATCEAGKEAVRELRNIRTELAGIRSELRSTAQRCR